MTIRIELTVTSTNHAATGFTGDGDVRFTHEYETHASNGRYDADVVLTRGNAMLTDIAKQLAALADAGGGALFDVEANAARLGR